jgi:hypothetical protein
MSEHRFSASVGSARGELRITPDGLAFVPSAVERDGQLTMDLRGWAFDWHQVDGIERVGASRVQSREGVRGGALRIHYAGYLRYVTVQIHEQLEPVFEAVDSVATEAA